MAFHIVCIRLNIQLNSYCLFQPEVVWWTATPPRVGTALNMLRHNKFGSSHTQTIFFGLMPLMVMAGCIAIPVHIGDKPYYTGAIPNLEAGVTSKSEVLQEFGVPDATYHRDSELIYTTTEESWKVLFISETYSGLETYHKRFVLFVSFDSQDVLTAYEADTAGDDFGDCTSRGICFGITNAVMRYADSQSESKAKGFKLNKDQCSIYLYGLGNKKAYEVSLNGKIPVSVFSTRAFVHWITKPGPQSLVIFPEPAFLDFDCKAGEIAFVHFDFKRFGRSQLRLESNAIGREHVSRRRMVLLPSG